MRAVGVLAVLLVASCAWAQEPVMRDGHPALRFVDLHAKSALFVELGGLTRSQK